MSKAGRNKSEKDHMLELIHEYSKTRDDGPIRMIDVAGWAFSEKKWVPQKARVVKDLAARLSKAAKTQRYVDAQGRRVRELHAAKYPKIDEKGQLVFETMWDYALLMSLEHAQISFDQRWHQVEGAAKSLRRDVDSFNDNNPRAEGRKIQMSFNFEYATEPQSAQIVEELAADS